MDMQQRLFVGRGPLAEGRTSAWRTETLDEKQVAEARLDHPADYEADPGLVDAMNVALLLGRPLLLTGRPGTGKSQFADRVAWEFNLAPVLRFEAQSVSEAQDLFYRFDMVGRLAAANVPGSTAGTDPRRYITLSALGKAVLYSHPYDEKRFDGLTLKPPHPAPATGRASVVLIDEIDKASRDFPNDLLNAIERLAFKVTELEDREFEAARGVGTRPIVIITSNSERELPEPFLRRCVYYNIPDPVPDTLKRIVCNRVLNRMQQAAGSTAAMSNEQMPVLFKELVDCFVKFRDEGAKKLSFTPGTSELIDLSRVVAADREAQPSEPLAKDVNFASARRASAAVAKGRGDAEEFDKHLNGWRNRK
jgi:MoxR-like ATPase